MSDDRGKPDFVRLRAIQMAAVLAGALVFTGSGFFMGVLGRPEVAMIVLACAFAGAAFGAVFYFGALLLEGSLQKYILSDDTVIKGDNVGWSHARRHPETRRSTNGLALMPSRATCSACRSCQS